VITIVAACPPSCRSRAARRSACLDTAFQLLGPDHKVVVEAFDDPKVTGVVCYVSRAKTGGIKGRWALPRIRRASRSRAGHRRRLASANRCPGKKKCSRARRSCSSTRVVRIVDAKRTRSFT
jgi:CreA protein